jgi:hypothetical protein
LFKCQVYFCRRQYGVSTAVRKGPPERLSTPSVTSCTLYILHESLKPNQKQPPASTSPSTLVTGTLSWKIEGNPLSRAQGRSHRHILRQSGLGPEARQNMSNVYVRLLGRARTVNKLPSPAHRQLLKDEEGRWPRPVSVCGFIGLGSNFGCSLSHALSPDSLSGSLARSIDRSRSLALSPHARTHTHTPPYTHH